MEIATRILQLFVGAAAIGLYILLLVGGWPPPNVHGDERWFYLIFFVISNVPILLFSLFVCIVLRKWNIVIVGMFLISCGVVLHFVVSVLAGHSNSILILLLAFGFELILFALVASWILRKSSE